MIKYLIKKAVILVFSLFIVATLTFFLMHAVPGDPFTQEQAIPEEILKALYKHYGLDQSLGVQYLHYLKGLITWDLGPSFKYQGRTVTEIIGDGFPVSLALGVEALTFAIIIGITVGSISALKHLKWQDQLCMAGAVLGISVPSFICATFLQYLFSMKLDLLPVARWGTFAHSILPALALSSLPTAFIARMTRANMVEIFHQDYVLTAKSKGINNFQLIFHHVLRNSLLPIVTYLGPLTTGILTGSFAVEKIFGIPGLGQWFVLSITNRDYTVIMGTTIFYSAFLMLCIFLIDLLYCFIDPRIQLVQKKVKI